MNGLATARGTRTPTWTACARCGHGSNVHGKACRACDCEKWVGGVCDRCGGWRFSTYEYGLCSVCYKVDAAERKERLRSISAAHWEKLKERDALVEERRVLTEGRQTLEAIKALIGLKPRPVARCLRCGFSWHPRVFRNPARPRRPQFCGRCHSTAWDKPRNIYA